MISKREGTRPGTVLVTFELPAAIWAETIHLVGDFNAWSRQSHPLVHSRDDGPWHITLELEKGKTYQFRYLVNGSEWQNDWQADQYVSNPFGGENSVVQT